MFQLDYQLSNKRNGHSVKFNHISFHSDQLSFQASFVLQVERNKLHAC